MNQEHLAEESSKTQRARAKLKKKLDKIDAQINPQALGRKVKEIHQWIARHAHTRICLKHEKTIALFDENQNSASQSRRIESLALRCAQDLASPLEKLREKVKS